MSQTLKELAGTRPNFMAILWLKRFHILSFRPMLPVSQAAILTPRDTVPVFFVPWLTVLAHDFNCRKFVTPWSYCLGEGIFSWAVSTKVEQWLG
jgi:hypothetical protein